VTSTPSSNQESGYMKQI